MRTFATAAAAVTALAMTIAAAIGQGPAENVVADPGFERPALHAWSQCGTVNARVTTAAAHGGTHAMRAGSSSRTSGEIDGDAGLCQPVAIPAGGVLTFWLNGITDETSAEYSYQSAELLDDEGNTVATLWQASLQSNGWARKTVDLSAFAGRTLRLYFGVHGNGYAKRFTILYVDDVSVSGGTAPATPAASGVPTAVPSGSPSAAPATPVPSGGPTPIPAPQAGGPATCGTHCGTERWHVKTLSDPFASQIDRNVRITTVDELVHAPVPSGMSAHADNVRFAPWELQAVQVRATIVGWKIENDNDYHIVIADPGNASETMIVEPPSSACSGACSSGYGALFQSARQAFVACLGDPPAQFGYRNTPIVALITGVPMFDILHGQTGVAPNGIEIHPVISVAFESGC